MKEQAAVAALRALAFETRLKAVQMLATVGDEGLSAGELSRRLGVQQNTLSDHLASLARAGVVTAEKKSRSVIFRANPTTLNDIVTLLVTTCGARATAKKR